MQNNETWISEVHSQQLRKVSSLSWLWLFLLRAIAKILSLAFEDFRMAGMPGFTQFAVHVEGHIMKELPQHAVAETIVVQVHSSVV